MKILHVGFGFLPWRYGGLILYAEDLMDTQLAAGHEVAYFFTGRRYPVGPKDRLRTWVSRCQKSTFIWGLSDRGFRGGMDTTAPFDGDPYTVSAR